MPDGPMENIGDFSPSAPSQTLGGLTPWAEVSACAFSDGGGRTVSVADILLLKDAVDALKAAPSGGSVPVGTPCLLAQRRGDLPDGFWFPSGDYFPLDSAVGQVLDAFSDAYKTDWGITVQAETIRLYNPDKFFDAGRGRFFRPVNSVERVPGSVESDAGRNITGSVLGSSRANYTTGYTFGSHTGAFYDAGGTVAAAHSGNQTATKATLGLDASLAWGDDHTAVEFRPANLGLTPAVYLGVPHG